MEDHEVFIAEANRAISATEARTAVTTLKRIGKSLHRIYERQCNGHQTPAGNWDEEAAKKDDAREEKLEAQARALLDSYGIGLYLNADPRGNPIGILTPKSERYNTMGGRECGWRL
jgi:hypothetical protein